MMSPRTLRLVTLVAPIMIVGAVCADADRPLHGVGFALAVLWGVLATLLIARFVHASRQVAVDEPSPLDRIDVLTASGTGMVWTGAAALVAASYTGWASLSVVGVLGLATVYLAALWTTIAAGGDRAWRVTVVTRAVLPVHSTEGDALREEISIDELAIPIGMRLFVLGRTHRHGAVSRYVVDAREGGRSLQLASDLGPARRGDHHAPALAMWFGDVLGLTRSAVVHRGATAFTVVPRPPAVEGVRSLLGAGGDDATSIQTQHAPTEGTFRIREYHPGDDARRIHWVRSLQQDQLVMRLPDEVPPADRVVRLVLDTELGNLDRLTCRAPDDLLDVLVRVWLGIGKALVATGTRVTLVAPMAMAGVVKRVERPLQPRAAQRASELGARVEWQTALPLAALVDTDQDKHVVVSARARRIHDDKVAWVVVPEAAWLMPEDNPEMDLAARLPFAIGAAENRPERRERERRKSILRWQDRAMFSQVTCWADWKRFSGDHVARPHADRVIVAVIP